MRRQWSWTHYRILLRVDKPAARAFYEAEAINARWSTRELERQIHSLLFERLALSRDKEGVLALAEKGHEIHQPADLVKDPYVLEFAGLPQGERYLESDLEQGLIDKLQAFLLELGRGFAFMTRQQRLTLDATYYFIDLVFYNRLTRCFVLIDLKVGELTHQDLGQMQMYVNYYQRELTNPDENPPIGIVLCTDKSAAVVRYGIAGRRAGRLRRVLPQLRRQRRHACLRAGVTRLQLGPEALQGVQGRPGFGQGLGARLRQRYISGRHAAHLRNRTGARQALDPYQDPAHGSQEPSLTLPAERLQRGVPSRTSPKTPKTSGSLPIGFGFLLT